jgi:hypothetical protein
MNFIRPIASIRRLSTNTWNSRIEEILVRVSWMVQIPIRALGDTSGKRGLVLEKPRLL